MADGLGVAVIGAGMAGRAHAAAYRTASALYSPVLPPIRLVSIGDVNAEFGSLAARRFGCVLGRTLGVAVIRVSIRREMRRVSS